MNINIQDAKIELIQWLAILEDISTIEKLVQLKKQEHVDRWNDITVPEKKSIEKGMADAKAGNVKPHTSAKKVYEKWL